MLYNFTNAGLVVPDSQAILETVQGEFLDIFGSSDLILDSSSIIGRMIEHETLLRIDVLNLCANVLNNFNPNYSTGVYLDSAMAMVNLTRSNGSNSTAIARVYGTVGTILPSGARASTLFDDLFVSQGDQIVGSLGWVDVPFVSLEIGAISIKSGELNRLMDYFDGITSITNITDGVTGTDRDSDKQAREKRISAMFSNSSSSVDSIYSNLLNPSVISGVSSCYVQENTTKVAATINGILMAPNSLYCCVQGGRDEDVANVIFNKKSLGSALVGSVTHTITTLSGLPVKIYFDRPTNVIVMIGITVKLSGNSTIEDVKNAILAQAYIFQKIGRTVNAFEIASCVFSQIVSVISCSVNGGQSVVINANQIPVITDSTIQVVVAS